MYGHRVEEGILSDRLKRAVSVVRGFKCTTISLAITE